MATNYDQGGNIPNSFFDSSEKDILTLEGYKKLFAIEGEDSFDAFSSYTNLYNMYDPTNWWDKLSSWKINNLVKCLFAVRDILFTEEKLMHYDDYDTLIQFFSLLGNVFRNVLLRPYIPAYRTINKDCGRYRSFVQYYENIMPFTELQFESNGSNLLTYKGTHQTNTILYALTCSILCQYFRQRLKTVDRHSNRQQQRQTDDRL